MTDTVPPHSSSRLPGPPGPLQRAKRRVWVACCICVFIICIILGVVIGWTNRVLDFGGLGSPNIPSGRAISFEVDLISVDPTAGQITLDWYFWDDTACSNNITSNETMCSMFVDIFFDPNLLRTTETSSPALDNNIPQQPVFRYNATAYFNGDIRTNIAAFRTSVALLSLNGSVSSLQNYPFDSYIGDISLFAQQSPTNESVDIEISYTWGVAVGFKAEVTYNSKSASNTDAIYDELIISRGVPVKTFALVIVIAVWAITLVFVASTIATVFFGYPQKISLLVVPVPLLFTITQLRTTMPGAPPFGAIIDYIGLLPCIALMSVCATVSTAYIVFSNPEDHRETFTAKLVSHTFRKKGQGEQEQPIET